MASSDNDSLKKIGPLLEEATRFQEGGRFRDAELLIEEAGHLAGGNVQCRAEIDLFRATSLLKENRREEGLRNLSAMLIEYAEWIRSPEGRDMYDLVQLQRAFSLMHLEKYEEARPLLEEATAFQLDTEVQSDVRCHLGRCYHELSQYSLAKEQFECAHSLGVGEDWQSVFHYYFGYTLYELGDFQLAKREFILCLQSGPSSPDTSARYSMLAATSRKLGEHSEARFYAEKAKSRMR